jgi:DNA-binding transcriptional MerR regulator
VSPRYTDEQIRELCGKAIIAQGQEFEVSISELKAALRDRAQGLSNLAVAMILQMPSPAREEDFPEAETERKEGA